mmetsp:Transcript_35350/g.92454  ORF Transcript_35350/g.92454 Transcript_35350/m.92454 type:complete len:456 (-) Transcript_35350:76-1443(-)
MSKGVAHMRPAGCAPVSSEPVAQVMLPPPEEDIPEQIKYYHTLQQPEVGGRTPMFKPPALDPNAVYGVKTVADPNDSAGPLINPPKISRFEEALLNSKKPVRKVELADRAHREGIVASGMAFGDASEHGGTAAECIRPEVSPEAIAADEEAQVTLYRRSHGSYGPGEQVQRGYDGGFDKAAVCGMPTPQDTRGSGVAKTLRWSSSFGPPALVTAGQRAHANGLPPPVAVTDDNTVFGVVTKPIGDTVGALIATAGPAEDDAALREQVRSLLTPSTAAKLGLLEDEFMAADATQTGVVPAAVAQELCKAHLSHDLGPRALDDLLSAATADGGVDWTALMDIVRPPVTPSADDFPCGIATIRKDLPAPSFTSVTETRNFGDQGGAGTVITPTLYTTRGLPPTAVQGGRNKDDIKRIFETAGLNGSVEFETVWARATELANADMVSVETFKEALVQLA